MDERTFYCKVCGYLQNGTDCDDMECNQCHDCDWSPREKLTPDAIRLRNAELFPEFIIDQD
jgi:hypothetical protein